MRRSVTPKFCMTRAMPPMFWGPCGRQRTKHTLSRGVASSRSSSCPSPATASASGARAPKRRRRARRGAFARDVLDDAVDAARGLDLLAGARWRAEAGRNVAWARIVAMARSGPKCANRRGRAGIYPHAR